MTNGSAGLLYKSFLNGEQFHLEMRSLSRRPEHRPIFAWLPGWRLEADRGLCYRFRNHFSEVAFAYSDIFESRANPEKGGHGPAVLFRYALGQTGKRASQIGRGRIRMP